MKYEVWKNNNSIMLYCKKTSNFTTLNSSYNLLLKDIKFNYPITLVQKIKELYKYQGDVNSVREFYRKYCK
jgi:hypothetical protein